MTRDQLVTFIDALENVKYNVNATVNLRDMDGVMLKCNVHEHVQLAVLRDAVLEDKDYRRAYDVLRQLVTYSVE